MIGAPGHLEGVENLLHFSRSLGLTFSLRVLVMSPLRPPEIALPACAKQVAAIVNLLSRQEAR